MNTGPPDELLARLLAARRITPEQARWVAGEAARRGTTAERILVERGVLSTSGPGGAPLASATPPPAAPAAPPRPSGPPAPGTTWLDRYRIDRELGRGGMGVVLEARDERLGRTVAIKLLLEGVRGDAAVRRFQIEAQAAGKLSHPNVVAVHETGVHAGLPYLVLEFVAGKTLSALLAENDLPLERAVGHVRDVALALAHAHAQGVVHRDVKPDNVLVEASSGRAKLADFGIARASGGDSMTVEGQLLGTPQFMSPEQAAGETSRVGPASDVYSLGATLFSVLAGRPPFVADTNQGLLKMVIFDEPSPPRAFRPGVSPDLETIALRCLAKEPRERYASAQAVADELDRWLRGEPIFARPIGARERLGRWVRRNKRLTAALAAVPLVALGTALPFVLGERARRAQEAARVAAERADAERAAAERRARFEAALARVEKVPRDVVDVEYRLALEEVVATATSETALLLIPPVERATALLRAASRKALLDANEPDELERSGGVEPLPGAAAHVDAWLSRPERGVIAPEVRTTVEELWVRLEARRSRRLGRLEKTGVQPGLAQILASAHEVGVAPATLRASSFACEALGRLRVRAAVPVLAGFVRAHANPARAAVAGVALARIGGTEAVSAAIAGRLVHVRSAYWSPVHHALEASGARADWPATTDEELVRRAQDHLLLGDDTAALRDADAVLERDAANVAAHFVRGDVLLRKDPGAAAATADVILRNPRAPSERARAHAMRAQARRLLGDLERASADIAAAVAEDPGLGAVYSERGLVSEARGELESALVDLTRAIDLDPDYGDNWLDRARIRERLGDHVLAIGDVTRAIALDPEDGSRLAARARLWRLAEDLSPAFEDAEAAVLASPRCAAAWLERGRVLMDRGRLGEARDDVLRSIALDPGVAEAHAALSRVSLLLADAKQAEASIGRALELGPREPGVWLAKGLERIQAGDVTNAIAAFTSATVLDPSLARARTNLAAALARGGRLAEAETEATRAVELAPRAAPGLVTRAEIRLARGDSEGALADVSRAIDLDPGLRAARLTRARAAGARGDHRTALRDLAAAGVRAPGDGEVSRDLGRVLAAMNKLPEARRMLDLAIARDPRDAKSWFFRGQLRVATRDVAGGKADLERARTLDPGGPVAAEVEKAFAKLGDAPR